MAQDGDLFGGQEAVGSWGEVMTSSGATTRRAAQQGAEDFPDRDIEGVGVPLRPHPAGGDVEIELGEQGGGVVVGDGHAFGGSGGAGGVDQIRQVVGVGWVAGGGVVIEVEGVEGDGAAGGRWVVSSVVVMIAVGWCR
ncbi:hypothetical protein MM1218R_03305 [Mycobacterium marinum]|nr:hypothetical protein [Mycobacterium marinum]AXN45240.1 hypothetical protein MM1218R_03305 [Mycobacterium marinum]